MAPIVTQTVETEARQSGGAVTMVSPSSDAGHGTDSECLRRYSGLADARTLQWLSGREIEGEAADGFQTGLGMTKGHQQPNAEQKKCDPGG
ncbi:hypothetical protein G7046_g2775 [Stylonectria norvegica]|nr:hypothetical protein G7046_g2775 [Stylonectria norvegica]